ncbi:TolC family protein [Sphingomonas koreensis]|nr:TolC family protein [Sphingomonas koreensis]
MRRSGWPLAGALMLAACTTYSPQPIDDDPAILSEPTAAALSEAAATIDRPYLIPTAIDLGAPLDANAVATIAVIANPDLKAMRARAGVSDAQAFAARLLPDPSFSIGASPVLAGPDPFVDLASALGLDINALRTRRVQRAQAAAQAKQVRLDLAWAEWQTAGQARIQTVRIQSLEHSVAIDRASYAVGRSLLDRTLHAAGRGDLSADQVQAARVSAFDAQAALRTAERDLAAARFDLTKLLGLLPTTQITLAPEPLPAAPPEAASLFALAKEKRADLLALQAGYAAQEAAVHKAILDQFPNLTLTVNASRDSSANTLLGPAVDFTLPLWNRNRGGIAIERATRAALKVEYDARLFQARAEIAAAVGGINVARRQREAIDHDLPALETFAAASRKAANRGDLSLATAETAEQALRDKQALLAQSDQDIAEQTIALELLTGTPKEAWPR